MVLAWPLEDLHVRNGVTMSCSHPWSAFFSTCGAVNPNNECDGINHAHEGQPGEISLVQAAPSCARRAVLASQAAQMNSPAMRVPAVAGFPSGPRASMPTDLRRSIFLHSDGLMLALFIEVLEQRQLLTRLKARGAMSIEKLAAEGGCNAAYLHVVLRALAQEGWLTRHGEAGSPQLTYTMTPAGQATFSWVPLYRRVAKFVSTHAPFEKTLLRVNGPGAVELELLLVKADAGWADAGWDGVRGAAYQHLQQHLSGALLIPLLIGLWQLDRLDAPWSHASESRALASAVKWFTRLQWIDPLRQCWTARGHLVKADVLQYGLVASYLPMLLKLPALLYGSAQQRTHAGGDHESHVDRRLNVLASAHAHQRYFRDADELIVAIFNAEPLQEQPRFVLDVGCGDGTWLAHIYDVIQTRTLRGRHLREHPLLMIGADYNAVAVEITGQLLASTDAPVQMLRADVSDPDGLAARLDRLGLRMQDGLHIRGFIDHNRVYRPDAASLECELHSQSRSTGAYVDEAGGLIANRELVRDLTAFLRRWTPHVGRHGLIVLEAHCVDPAVTSQHPDATHTLAFDAYHALSHQYPVDFNVFMDAAAAAGLSAAPYEQQRYPTQMPFVAISLNRFVPTVQPILPGCEPQVRPGPTPGEWRPSGQEDLSDGHALHELLYSDRGIDKPRAWCAAATGALVARVLQRLEERVQAIEEGRTQRTLRVLDYGAGTGLFSIELLKAMQVRGLLTRLRRRGTEFELALADIPSGWFAAGYELLRQSRHTRFYSVRDAAGFVRLSQRIPHRFDVAVASMVFHLIPPAALGKACSNLAEMVREGGCLLWNTPDLGPARASAVLFHEANRRLRTRVLAYLAQPCTLTGLLDGLQPHDREQYSDLPAALSRAREQITDERWALACQRAGRQVLKEPNTRAQVHAALSCHFVGEMRTRSFEMRPAEALATILVPSNQHLLAEIEDADLRRRMTELVMVHAVLPQLCSAAARTSDGYAVDWTFGEYDPCATVKEPES